MEIIKPFTPSEVKELKLNKFEKEPLFIETINELMVSKFNYGISFTFQFQELKNLYSLKYKNHLKNKYSEEEIEEMVKKELIRISDENLYDFEEYFEKFGWKISYNSPCIDENFKDYYEFFIKK